MPCAVAGGNAVPAQHDEKGRPLFAYGRTIHEDCPRRAHFDAGRFAEQFGDENHRLGHCLYRLGCNKGFSMEVREPPPEL